MLNRASTTIGIAPITNEMINKELNILEKNKAISNHNNYTQKKQIVLKHIVRKWTKQYLDISDEIWDGIQIIEVRH